MAGEVVIQDGASGWVSVGSVSLTADVAGQVSASTIASLMVATEASYPQFDIQLNVTGGSPTENQRVQVHFRMKADGVNESPAPGGSFQPHFVGNVILDNALGYYYEEGLRVKDKLGTLYLKTATAITVSVSIRMRSHNAAV